MNGIESSIYFMLAMMFVGMPSAVIGGIAWECRKRSRAALEDSNEGAAATDTPVAPDASTTQDSV